MGVDAGGTPQSPGVQGRQCRRQPRAGKIGAGDHLAMHAGLGGARHDAVTIRCETVMRQIRTNIDQIQAQGGNLIMLSSIAILSAGAAA